MTKPRNSAGIRHPQEEANFISRLLLWWIFPLLWKGSRCTLQQEDLPPVRNKHQSGPLTKRLERKWEEETNAARKGNRTARLWRAMLRYFSFEDYMTYVVVYLIMALGQNICWYSLINLLQLVSNWFVMTPNKNVRTSEVAIVYIYAVLLGSLMEQVMRGRFNLHGATMGNKAKSGILGLLYNRVLRLSKMAIDTGHVMELICNDCQRLVTSGEWFVPTAFRFTVNTIMVVSWLLYFIGWEALPGSIFLMALAVLRVGINKIDYSLRKKASKLSDKRLGYIKEWLTMIYSVKVNCWEKIFEDKIHKTRWEEVKIKTKRWMISLICYAFTPCAQSLATYITVCTLTYTERNDIANINFFAMIYLYGKLTFALTIQIPTVIRLLSDVAAGLHRFETFLKTKECFKSESLLKESENGITISAKLKSEKVSDESEISNFTLDRPRKPHYTPFLNMNDVTCELPSNSFHSSLEPCKEGIILLKNIRLEVYQQGLVVVFGGVGSGKSSFLEIIQQRELIIAHGSVKFMGRIAFVSDSPWVFPGTVRENILFGLPYNEARYKKIIKACQLERDFDNFPEQDLTRIGELATVSGGQRTRIALARAVYSDADIYLLDDPLSSLDTSVAENVFTQCIQGLLSDRIVLLTTHATKYCAVASHIVHLDGGRIVNQGTFEAVKSSLPIDESNEKTSKSESQRNVWSDAGELMRGVSLKEEKEDRNFGSVSWKLCLDYFRNGASCLFLIIVPIIYFSGQGLVVLRDVLASHLPKLAGKRNSKFHSVFLEYSLVLAVAVVLAMIGSMLIFLLFMRTSYKVHNKMVACLLKAPLSFYANNPVGRIINRFSQDINTVEELLPYNAFILFNYILPVLATMILASITNPWLIIPFLLSLPLFYYIGYIYFNCSTDIKRLWLISSGPMYSHFSNTMRGLRTIRAHGRQKDFRERVFRYIDDHSTTVISFYTSVRCFGITCSCMAIILAVIVTIAVVCTVNNPYTAGLGAVTILYALNTSQYFDSIIRFGANANTQMTSAERAVAFTKINPERGHGPHEPPPEDWPRSGEVEFQNTSLRYYKGGPEVIKNISFKVNSKEKIGIVGRTGAGKSSLVAALMRLALTEGHIFVDGLDIRQIDVVSSRRAISVISQAPNLMNGTVKTNLDPYNEFSDTEIWSALKQTKMSSIISSLPQKLENEISSGGSSFSLGERQLMHLTRVLLKKSKIIIFDEATGKVDKKTDDDIQSIVRDVCEECTVITIAHRLSTVLDCNRILILDQGKIVDYGAPQLLLSKENSLLKQLVDISSEK